MSTNNLNELGDSLRSIDQAFKKQIEPYRQDLWRFCMHLTKSPWDAEDLVQDTLLKSLSVLAKVYQPVNTKSYLFKIASNLWIDQMRKTKKHTDIIQATASQDKLDNYQFELIEHLEIVIASLTPIQYVTLILGDVFLFKGKEIAEIIGSSQSAVNTNLHRARNIMKKKHLDLQEVFLKDYKKDVQTSRAMNLLLEGFRKKDVKLISSLLDENIVTDIVHSGFEMGANETRNNSLNDWHNIVRDQQDIVVNYIELWGQRVLVEMEKKLDNELYLNNIHYLEITDNKITYWKFYCFSWDIMKRAAETLEVQLNARYYYHIF
ncbi:RNA polymerase sigma factor [Cytobacillus sp. Hm23]